MIPSANQLELLTTHTSSRPGSALRIVDNVPLPSVRDLSDQ